ncbi:MAG: hypothetical protein QXF87_09885 [Thermofilaceae archaeon]
MSAADEELAVLLDELLRAAAEAGLLSGDEADTVKETNLQDAVNEGEDEVESVALWISQMIKTLQPPAYTASTGTAATIASARTTSAAEKATTETAKAALFDVREALGPLADEILRMLVEYISLRDYIFQLAVEGEASLLDLIRAHNLVMDMLNYIARYKLKIAE